MGFGSHRIVRFVDPEHRIVFKNAGISLVRVSWATFIIEKLQYLSAKIVLLQLNSIFTTSALKLFSSFEKQLQEVSCLSL